MLHRQEAAQLMEILRHTYVMQDSQELLQQAPVHPVPGSVLVRYVILYQGLVLGLPVYA